MNIFKQYIDYIKDNPEGYWFKRKLYGWGWTPATWQGWTVLGLFLLFMGLQTLLLELTAKTDTDGMLFAANVVLGAIALILVCKITGESPKWQWGIPKK